MPPSIGARHLLYLRFLGNASYCLANPDLFKIESNQDVQDKEWDKCTVQLISNCNLNRNASFAYKSKQISN